MRRFVAMTVAFGLLLSACSPAAPASTPADSKPGEPKSAAQATTAPAKPAEAAKPADAAKPAEKPAPQAPAAKPGRGGTLRLPIQTEPLPLNPITSNELSSLLVRRVIFSYLTRVDPQTRNPVPDLATSWTAAPDGLSWTFTLRDDVKWHDGTPFTSADVKFTWEAIADPKNSSVERSNYVDVERIETPDPKTVRFVLKRPLASLPVIAGATVGIIPKHLLEGQDLPNAVEFNTRRPIGTGPYKVKAVVPGSHVELEAHAEFYRGRPKFDQVIFKIIPDVNTRVAQLKAGELDFAVVEPTNLAAVEGERSLSVESYPSPEIVSLNINHESPLFTDKRVRQALEYGLDRKAILDNVALGKGVLGTGPLPAALAFWYDSSIQARPFDQERAKALLAEAGWRPGADGVLEKDGKRFSFKIFLDKGSAVREQIAVLAQQYYKRLGMDPGIDIVERTIYGQRLQTHEFELTVTQRPSSWDPDNQRRFYACKAGSNFGLYCNQKVDELLNAGVAEMDPNKRQAIYKEYQQVVFDDPVWVTVYYPDEIRVTTARLKGVPPLPIRDVLTYIDDWYFE